MRTGSEQQGKHKISWIFYDKGLCYVLQYESKSIFPGVLPVKWG